jgi:uncharacterized protein (DUF433 family)
MTTAGFVRNPYTPTEGRKAAPAGGSGIDAAAVASRLQGAYQGAMDYRERIVIGPAVRFGKPCVRGTRISVGDVLSYLASGMTEKQVLTDFPQLSNEDIRACLAFAAERKRPTNIPVA